MCMRESYPLRTPGRRVFWGGDAGRWIDGGGGLRGIDNKYFFFFCCFVRGFLYILGGRVHTAKYIKEYVNTLGEVLKVKGVFRCQVIVWRCFFVM